MSKGKIDHIDKQMNRYTLDFYYIYFKTFISSPFTL